MLDSYKMDFLLVEFWFFIVDSLNVFECIFEVVIVEDIYIVVMEKLVFFGFVDDLEF